MKAICRLHTRHNQFNRRSYTLISYVTDLEGDYDALLRFLSISKVVKGLPHKAGVRISFKDKETHSHFVFGGDLFDHGEGDIRLAKALCDFKNRYPNSVHLIAGNRDLNKLRLLNELSDEHLALPPSHSSIYRPHWQREDHRRSLESFLATSCTNKYLPSQSNGDTAINRLKWILRYTMGAGKAFEGRKRELNKLKGSNVSDQCVFESYRNSVRSGGFLRDYLKSTVLMTTINDTLVAHGGVTNENLGRLPPCIHPYTHIPHLKEWIQNLNFWQNSEMKAWENGDGCSSLIEYGTPNGCENSSVVYRSWLTKDRWPLIEKQTAEYLMRAGISTLLVGHTPHGQMPTTTMLGDDLYRICADISYCGSVSGIDIRDNLHERGQAACEVVIKQDANGKTISRNIHGQDCLGRRYDFCVEDHTMIGRSLSGTRWCKAVLNGDKALTWRPRAGALFPNDTEEIFEEL